jgi:hypothetical protein
MTRIKVMFAAIVVPVTMATFALVAQGAQASTSACTTGAYVSYCGTQADNGSPGLVLSSAGQGTGTNNKVIGWVNSTADPGTDWFQLAYGGSAANGIMFVFAPSGLISNMCAADPGNGLVVLRACNGSNFQRWIATPVSGVAGFQTWTNRATHKILKAGALGAQLVTVTPPTTPAGNEQWRFSA